MILLLITNLYKNQKKISFDQLKKQSILIIKIRKMLRLRNGTFCLKIFCFQLLFSLRSASNDYLFVVSSTVLSLSITERQFMIYKITYAVRCLQISQLHILKIFPLFIIIFAFKSFFTIFLALCIQDGARLCPKQPRPLFQKKKKNSKSIERQK